MYGATFNTGPTPSEVLAAQEAAREHERLRLRNDPDILPVRDRAVTEENLQGILGFRVYRAWEDVPPC